MDEPRELSATQAKAALAPAVAVLERFKDLSAILDAAVAAEGELANFARRLDAAADDLRRVESEVANRQADLRNVEDAIASATDTKIRLDLEVHDFSVRRQDAEREFHLLIDRLRDASSLEEANLAQVHQALVAERQEELKALEGRKA